MSSATGVVDDLDQQVEALVGAQSPSEIFKVLLHGAVVAAPRAAVFLVRQGQIKGWGSLGYDEAVARTQRAFSTASDAGWLGELVKDPDRPMQERSGTGADPDFGQRAATEAAAVAVRVKGRTIALVMAERADDELPWTPAVLSMLVRVAQLRLELDIALRKLKTAGELLAETGTRAEAAESHAAPVAPTAQAAPAEVEPTAVRPAPEPGGEEGDEVAAARRFARLVATDIRLYNEEAVVLGRRKGDLADRLSEQLGRGKDTFMKRHGELGSAALDILHEAFVEVLAAGKPELLPTSVLD